MKKPQRMQWPLPRTGRYLRVGERVTIGGKPYRVEMVNPSRARCKALFKKTVTVTDKVFNNTVTFRKSGGYVDITPTTW